MKHILPLITLLPALATAGEHTVNSAPFAASVTIDASFLPENAVTLSLEPKRWTEFKILDIKEHGAVVKAGESVGTLDVEGIDRKIADDLTDAALRNMALAGAERELQDLEKSTAWKLAMAEKTYERLKNDYAYYKETERPLQEEQSRRSLERTKRMLSYQEEELKQLLKMYAEDDLTEETEEIILKRQQASVDSARFAVKQAEIAHARAMEEAMPRKDADWEQSFLDGQLAYHTAKLTIPRALEQKRLEVKKMRLAAERATEAEAEVVADRQLMDLKSPVAGRVYHGEIAKGRWSIGQTAKFMKEGGLIPARTVFASIVPEGAPLKLHAFVEEAVVLQLQTGQKGHVTPTAAPKTRLPVTVEAVAPYPEADGKYHVALSLPTQPKDLPLVTGMKGKVKLVTYQKNEALTIPVAALEEGPDGTFLVKIKLADGESEKRPVTVGREAEGQIEVLSGLEAGQVVIVSGAAAP
jgi:multidrug efflux pump subunit AcrA (membrane-fusion protein)